MLGQLDCVVDCRSNDFVFRCFSHYVINFSQRRYVNIRRFDFLVVFVQGDCKESAGSKIRIGCYYSFNLNPVFTGHNSFYTSHTVHLVAGRSQLTERRNNEIQTIVITVFRLEVYGVESAVAYCVVVGAE